MGAWERVISCLVSAAEEERAAEEAHARAYAYRAMARRIARDEVGERPGTGECPTARRQPWGDGKAGEGERGC